jgi:hypothetical protein
MELLLTGTAILAAGATIRCLFLSAEVESLEKKYTIRKQVHDETDERLRKYVAAVTDENIQLKNKISRSYHSQYRVNGKFAKRPDPIVEEYKQAHKAYRGMA